MDIDNREEILKNTKNTIGEIKIRSIVISFYIVNSFSFV